MGNEPKNLGNKELLKYPILVMSIVLGIVVLDYFEYNIVSLGTGGIEVEKRITNTLEGSQELSRKVDSLELLVAQLFESRQIENQEQIDRLVSDGSGLQKSDLNDTITGVSVKSHISTYQFQASDLTTKINKDLDEIKHANSKVGWIWIGNYAEKAWSTCMLKRIDGKALPIGSPESIQKNEVFEVTGNMYIRKYLPPNTDSYFRSVNAVGIVPNGSEVEVLEPPQAIDRGFQVQYWMKIQYQ